ncbi:metal-dependent transcriptional regulator [Cellulomonas xiejunii]|uniref:Manganese transport regulator n=1 Tax=Cellulomonas xiejunii TaxID=2968083 RepID=A0ABY5KMY1_9CELL|nr:metal-dependent transcriptional regulator [Cellulomonas xiejunii]MCC2316319.1 metal-dependent transcriptional regulator [Cellulomonas xiejunii]MCC2320094.1 metal-dependent transcriptional regulator [Cellulomonas xiejunii]UUI70405.1 metal-dependent transcriptional regulator [Cellulomonas xiejunii]
MSQSAAPLSAVTQDYLKVIWGAQEWSDVPVTTKLLASRLGVGASTVSETVKRLADAGLVSHRPYGAVELTAAGRAHAVAMVRRHRLIETYLVEKLGYGWDEVHDEAEVLEHAVSDRFVERVADLLGHPDRDPHGDPIPAADGTVHLPDARVMWEVEPGEYRVARISDADPELLRYLEGVGLVLDAPVTLDERRAVTGVVSVLPAGRPDRVELGEVAASAIWLAARD